MRRLIASVCVLAVGIGGGCSKHATISASDVEDLPPTIFLPGIRQPVTIKVDVYGVPHIYAKNNQDLFFAQGFNAARDRLWQMDYWRRSGLGELSQVFGSDYINRDRAAKLLLYRGGLDKEWRSYGSQAKSRAHAFADGVNAFIALTQNNKKLLPIEFQELGYTPGEWDADEAIRIRGHGVWFNLDSEVERSQFACAGKLEYDALRVKLEPERQPGFVNELNACDIPWKVLETYHLGRFPGEGDLGGSNNWAIEGRLTDTGRPILASDPHRKFTVPSMRYVTHLSSPDLNVIGAGEPQMPGVSVGHNGSVAFGFTIFTVDQEDLVVLTLNPDNPDQYLDKDGWKAFETVSESIKVASTSPVSIELKYSRHGAILHVDEEKLLAFALRTMSDAPGTAPYMGQMNLLDANSVSDFDRALESWGGPGEHFVVADKDSIAWRSAAKTPIRQGYDGLTPIPGHFDYEWVGVRDLEELPGGENPPSGWIATANNIQIPDAYDYEQMGLSYEWVADWRAKRIADVLSSGQLHSIKGSVDLQTDVGSIFAEEVVRLVSSLELTEKAALDVQTRFVDWDKRFDASSKTAALFQVFWYGHIAPGILERAELGELEALLPLSDERTILELLRRPEEAFWGTDPVKRRNQFLETSLKLAKRDLGFLMLGKSKESQNWGGLLKTRWRHPLHEKLSKDLRRAFTIPEVKRGGDLSTPGFALFDDDFSLLYGASFRMVVDVGAWDNSVFVNSPGQSGNPNDKNYTNLFETWANDEAVPLLYSDAAIDANIEKSYLLVPNESPEF